MHIVRSHQLAAIIGNKEYSVMELETVAGTPPENFAPYVVTVIVEVTSPKGPARATRLCSVPGSTPAEAFENVAGVVEKAQGEMLLELKRALNPIVLPAPDARLNGSNLRFPRHN